MDISQIITPYDAIKLDDKQQYQFYFELMQHTLDSLSKNANRLQSAEINLQEIEFIKGATDRLLYTINALELRYLHIDENTMEIDVTESGYPNASALRFLANEISFLEEGQDYKIESVESIVDSFVDKLLVKKERVSKDEVAQAAFSLFHNSIDKEKLHKSFTFGGVQLSQTNGYKYVAYWMNYDVLYNRPFVSMMYFNLEAGNNIFTKMDKLKLAEIVGKTVAVSPIKSVIYEIDKSLPQIVPLMYKRLDLGPIASIFSRDERIVSTALRDAIKTKELNMDAYAIELIMEKVVSSGSIDTGRRFSFVKKDSLQHWDVVEKFEYLLAPHSTIQYMYNHEAEMIRNLANPPIDLPPKSNKLNEL